MVRIKVIHASKLLAAAAAVILAIALIVLAAGAASGAARKTSSERAAAVAAFSFWKPPEMEFELPGENEHADLIVIEDADAGEDRTQPVERPRVLIYHTHTHEAYAQTAADPYRETESWRTEDQAHSVVRVGEALAALLTDYGFDVVHDTADYEHGLRPLARYAGDEARGDVQSVRRSAPRRVGQEHGRVRVCRLTARRAADGAHRQRRKFRRKARL